MGQVESNAWTRAEAWTGTRAPLAESTGLDPACYTDPDFHQLELERVFERAWVCVGVSSDVTEPGSVLVRSVGRRSVLISRDRHGGLHGFLNSCRHRGTELLDCDQREASTIRCPYHRWGYGLDGALISTPLFERVPRVGFDKADYGLIPVRVDTWGPLLFVCLDPNTIPLAGWLGDLGQRMAGYQLERWRRSTERTIPIGANWKLVSENYQEYYHLTWVHPELAKVSRVADHYRYQGPGMYCGQTTTPVSGDDRDDWLVLPPKPGLDASDGCSGRFVAIFPNVLLSVLPNHVLVMRLEPVAPDRTVEICTFLLPPETPSTDGGIDPATLAATEKFWFEVNDEDIGIVQRGQRGLAAGAVPAGPLSPRFEEPLHRFHNMLADVMTLDCLSALSVPPGDRPGDDQRYGTAPNPRPPAVEGRQQSSDQ